MNKARLNYWVDMATGLALVLSAVSGLVFLLPSTITAGTQLQILGVGYQTWSQLHTWSSLAMIGGALAHLALHWQWVTAMTKKTLRPATVGQAADEQAVTRGWSRRRVLQLGGVALASGAAVVGYKALFGARETPVLAADDSRSSSQTGSGASSSQVPVPVKPQTRSSASPSPTPLPVKPQVGSGSGGSSGKTTVPATCLACPRGISYDPYPGRCRLYRDRDGDRYCDLSIPTACSNSTSPSQPNTAPGNQRTRPSAPSQTF